MPNKTARLDYTREHVALCFNTSKRTRTVFTVQYLHRVQYLHISKAPRFSIHEAMDELKLLHGGEAVLSASSFFFLFSASCRFVLFFR